jgi:hypothetical protein
MAAVLIPPYLVPTARTNADWAMDIAFQGEDWTDSTVSVIFGRRGLPAYSVEATIGDGLLASTADLAVALRIPASTWAGAPPADYTVQVRRLKDGAIDDAATFTLKLERGLGPVAVDSAPILSGAGDVVGSAIVDRIGSTVSVVRGGGTQGPEGPPPSLSTATPLAPALIPSAGVSDKAMREDAVLPLPVPLPASIPDQVYQLQAADIGRVLSFTASGEVVVLVPADLPAGFNVQLVQTGGGTLTVTGKGATIRAPGGLAATNAAYQRVVLSPLGANEYLVSGGAAVAAKPLRIVATRGEAPQNFALVSAASRVTVESRARIFLGRQPTDELRLALCGYYCEISTLGVETDLGNAVAYECALEFNGVTARFLWDGSNSKSVPSGAALVLSDALLPAAFGLAQFPAGGAAFVRMRSTVAIGERTLVGPQLTSAGEGGFQHSGTVNQLMATGAMTLPAGGSARPAAPPFLAVLGRWSGAPDVSVIIEGASQAYGLGDNLGDGEIGGGYVKRALWSAGKVAWANISRSSTVGANANLYTKRRTLYAYATHVFTDYGTNDLDRYRATADSDVAAADGVRAILRSQWVAQRRAGLHITQSPVTPRLTSTDQFKTPVGQTPINRNGPGQGRDIINGYLVADQADGLCDEVFDANPPLVDPAEPWKFVTDGVTPLLATTDGVHYSVVKHAELATALLPRASAWVAR